MAKKEEQVSEPQGTPVEPSVPGKVPAANAPTQPTVKGLFDALMKGSESIPTITGTTTSGKRWHYVQREVADEVIIIHRYQPINTQYGDSYLADIDYKGEQTTLLIGADVLKTQLEEMEEYLPMVAVISKPGKAYVFMDPTPEQLKEYYDTYLS